MHETVATPVLRYVFAGSVNHFFEAGEDERIAIKFSLLPVGDTDSGRIQAVLYRFFILVSGHRVGSVQLYIELGAMRFKQKVRFSVHVSPEIDRRYLCIPPQRLQPYVENAIWHGLMHKAEGGTVTIEVNQPRENLLHIEITDDGVGRERAGELKSKSAGKHKLFGMQVTTDRIHMINRLYKILPGERRCACAETDRPFRAEAYRKSRNGHRCLYLIPLR